MKNGRRWFLSSIMMVLAGAESLFAALQQGSGFPRFPRIPDASQPFGGANIPPPLRPDPRAILKENQKKLKEDVAHLVKLVGELKKEVDNTDQADVLSLTLIHKADDVEKLAKKIKSLTRAE